jgi:transposase-like protein
MKQEDLIGDYLVDQKRGMRQVVTHFLNNVMQAEAAQQVGADHYERTDKRNAYRNGVKKRRLVTRYGTIILDKPQIRNFSFETKVIPRYARVEKAMEAAIIESYLQGVSTRRVQDVVSQLGVESLSASTVSRIAKELDQVVEEFLKRPIELPIRYFFIDASYFKVRSGGQYLNKALFVATGVREDGYREILGAKIADVEDEGFWSVFFEELKDRGLRGVQLVISDGHKGIQKAVQESFLGASWQLCNVHFERAVLKSIKQKDKREIASKLMDTIEDETKLQQLAVELSNRKYSKAADTIERYLFDLGNYKAFPREHWKRIRTTNGVERINKELKRRSRVVGAFPSDQSLMRVAGCLLMDINEEWITGNKYLSMEVE